MFVQDRLFIRQLIVLSVNNENTDKLYVHGKMRNVIHKCWKWSVCVRVYNVNIAIEKATIIFLHSYRLQKEKKKYYIFIIKIMQAKISRRNKSRHANSTSNTSEIKEKTKWKKDIWKINCRSNHQKMGRNKKRNKKNTTKQTIHIPNKFPFRVFDLHCVVLPCVMLKCVRYVCILLYREKERVYSFELNWTRMSMRNWNAIKTTNIMRN